MTPRSIGVEEEMFLVDPETTHLVPVSQKALRADRERDDSDEDVQQELYREQIESNTEPVATRDDLRASIVSSRRRAAEAAAAAGAALMAVGVPPLSEEHGDVSPSSRYRRMLDRYGLVARESLACGMHVHVGVADESEAVRAVDGLSRWMPLLLALSAGSPFFQGADTGYASWREQLWDSLPSAGPVEAFGTPEAYHRAVEELIASGAAIDEGMIYFDARLALSYPTVEIRVSDVCAEVDDALVVAVLARALVETVAAESEPAPHWRVDLLRGARWLARRDGLTGALLDPRTTRPVPAADVLANLVDFVRPALDAAGDTVFVRDGVERLLRDGGPAGRQRAVAGDDADVGAVARYVVDRTAASYASQ
jgi:carboxylate-amine ligase